MYNILKQNCTIDATKYFLLFSNPVIDAWNSFPDFIVAAWPVNDFKQIVCAVFILTNF